MKDYILIKGTLKEVIAQLYSLKAFYGENASISEIVENENKTGDKNVEM